MSTDKMEDGFTEGVIEVSMQLTGGVGRLGISKDPQPAFNWLEEGEVQPEEGDKSEEREKTGEMVDALMDMFVGGCFMREVKKEKQRGEAFCMM